MPHAAAPIWVPHCTTSTHGADVRSIPETALPKPPNYKQDKKRREELQKRKNQEEQLRKAARKNKTPIDTP